MSVCQVRHGYEMNISRFSAICAFSSLLMAGSVFSVLLSEYLFWQKLHVDRSDWQFASDTLTTDIQELFLEGMEESSLAVAIDLFDVDRDEFSALAENHATTHELELLIYSPVVTDRSSFEENITSIYGTQLHITDMSENGTFVPAEDRQEYWPILYRYPDVLGLIGYDMYSIDAVKQAIDFMKETSSVSISNPISFADTGEPGVVIVQPVRNASGLVLRGIRASEFFDIVDFTAFEEDFPGNTLGVFLVRGDEALVIYYSALDGNVTNDPTTTTCDDQCSGFDLLGQAQICTCISSVLAVTRGQEYIVRIAYGLFVTMVVTIISFTTYRFYETRKQFDAKNRLVSDVSHEIKTPMNGIIGMLELLGEKSLDVESRGYIRVIRASTMSLLSLVNDVLDMSTIEEGSMGITETRNILYEVVHQSLRTRWQGFVESCKAYEEQKDIEMILEIDECLMVHPVLIDAAKTRQIVENLVSNALRYTAEGRVTIRVSLDRVMEPGKGADSGHKNLRTAHVTIDVSDTGVGMSKQLRQMLFSPHPGVRKDAYINGNDVGLIVCTKLAALMGGKMTCKSEVGVGSSLTFAMVCAIATEHGNEPEPPVPRGPTKSFVFNTADNDDEQERFQAEEGKETEETNDHPLVLVVDDNKVNRMVAASMFQALGSCAESTEDGAKALELCQRVKYSLVLMDIQMPNMDGLEAARKITTTRNINRDTPIVFFTASANKETERLCLRAGGREMGVKPLTKDFLREIIRKYLVRAKETMS
ncbi:unnamed protein product [Pylaiella littoralis]